MIVAQVDRDYINTEPDSEYYRVGKTFELTNHGLEELFTCPQVNNLESLKVRFRCRDDDDEIYYGGWLYNDNDCEVQQAVLAWAMADAGCNIIEVKLNDVWTQEIG